MTKKTLGRSSGSLNAPIAAFTMAIVLCSYCIYSINSARRGAQVQAHSQSQGQGQPGSASLETAVQRRQRQMQRQGQDEWVQRVLEERDGRGRGSG